MEFEIKILFKEILEHHPSTQKDLIPLGHFLKLVNIVDYEYYDVNKYKLKSLGKYNGSKLENFGVNTTLLKDDINNKKIRRGSKIMDLDICDVCVDCILRILHLIS